MSKTFFVILLNFAAWSYADQQREIITVIPEETDGILANPGMGWETFHCTCKQDPHLPPWIPSTLHYARWGWGELEPRPGKLNAEFLDQTLRSTRDAGQKLAFRVMCCSTTPGEPYHPKWLAEIGGKEVLGDYQGKSPLPVPDLDDPIVLERHLDFIKRLGARYDGHTDIDHIDLGSIGWWGEWHMSGSKNCKMPSQATRQKVVDAYLAAFKKTPLLMLIGAEENLKQACRRGTGWRADCLGDLGAFSPTWNHMHQGYPTMIKEAEIGEQWKIAPVAWESGGDMREWLERGWSLRYILNYALACHGSILNNKSAPLPEGPEVRAELERFLRRLGHRLVLKELPHPAQVRPSEGFKLSMKWQNTGSAPCYQPYRLACRLQKTGTSIVRISPDAQAIKRLMPGSVELFTAEFFKLPPDLPPGEIVPLSFNFSAFSAETPPGEYTLSIAVVDAEKRPDQSTALSPGGKAEPTAAKPIVRLGIEGRAADGWYPLSTIQVAK
jgi:hypothetical protein